MKEFQLNLDIIGTRKEKASERTKQQHEPIMSLRRRNEIKWNLLQEKERTFGLKSC